MLRHKNALTLMELIVVLVIISIVVGFGLPNYTGALKKSRERDAELQLIALHAANITYYSVADAFFPGNQLLYNELNEGLGISIIPNGMIYSYNRIADNQFRASATWMEGGSEDFTIYVTEAPTSGGSNPCCKAGTNCPTLPDC